MPSRRIVFPGQVVMTSRRTTRRYCLFVPDMGGETKNIFWYCLTYCAQKFGIDVHVAVLMSNHIHLVITDVRGNRPNFFRELHRLLACCTKSRLGWPEEVFNKSKTSMVELVSTAAVIEKCGYAIANPTTAGLVRRSNEWPGARTTAADMGTRVVRSKLPKHYLTGSQWPEELELKITVPAVLVAEMKPEEARRRVQAIVRKKEQEALSKSKKTGKRFLGARRAQRVHHTERASSWEEFGGRNPSFAAGGDVEAAHATVARNRYFDADYNEALAGWTAGDRDVVFPHGTWWMRIHHGVRVRPPP